MYNVVSDIFFKTRICYILYVLLFNDSFKFYNVILSVFRPIKAFFKATVKAYVLIISPTHKLMYKVI